MIDLDIRLVKDDDNEWTFSIDGDGDLDGECHVLLLLSDEEVKELKRVVVNA